MTPYDVLTYYQTQAAIVRALSTTIWPATPQAVSSWFNEGRVPAGRQCQFQILTRGALQVDPAPTAPAMKGLTP